MQFKEQTLAGAWHGLQPSWHVDDTSCVEQTISEAMHSTV